MPSKLEFSHELVGRRALVTGGSRGIGATYAQRLLDAGAKVVGAARSRNAETPAEATLVTGDVRTSDGIRAIAAGAIEALGGLDILVNNAGGSNGFPEGRRRFRTRSGKTSSRSTSFRPSASPTPCSPRSANRRLPPS